MPFSSSQAGEVRAHTASPPLRPRATTMDSST